MSALRLRKVDPLPARATRELGAGQRLTFEAQGQKGELSLLPLVADSDTPIKGVWLTTAVGPLCLDDAEAVLSLLGDAPLTLSGEQQGWYWQFFNQRLSPSIAAVLAPIGPLADGPAPTLFGCRVQVRLAEESLHAHLHCAPETLLRLFACAPWTACKRPVDDAWSVTTPLIVGQLALTLDQLASLRPGDVLLPAHCQFDSAGQGRLALGGRQWAAHAGSQDHQLFLRLSHEEHAHHE
ncbi:type III secretion system protein [Pseudomonas sp. CDFA 602]|uniref:type III secretion system protein n=1 Tax=Pseudomonas californiensis TaxID=2829823 RepID=UPI001E4C346D|nr:type III secretion system protein [Pseudomonas californiensis]MCD5993871.1 type III secretion system protein [Pseudomonas californiensis]MCD5999626.1 type III secretion system protein [Pseudomonas californiensis]